LPRLSPKTLGWTALNWDMHLLFDLDGTLTDSREGVVRCIQHALAELGILVPPVEELTRYVGPPLPSSFATLLGTSDPARIELAIAAYRQRFERVGIFENALYPGIEEALAEFAAAGRCLCVVTAKPRFYARQILEHFNVAKLFRGIYGPELGQRQYSKESLIREACVEEKVTPLKAIMIGDRAEDILGAKRNALYSVGATWGYGEREELEAAQPDCLVTSSEELVEYIRNAA
jgi:phosphoglycolate phosphatase